MWSRLLLPWRPKPNQWVQVRGPALLLMRAHWKRLEPWHFVELPSKRNFSFSRKPYNKKQWYPNYIMHGGKKMYWYAVRKHYWRVLCGYCECSKLKMSLLPGSQTEIEFVNQAIFVHEEGLRELKFLCMCRHHKLAKSSPYHKIAKSYQNAALLTFWLWAGGVSDNIVPWLKSGASFPSLATHSQRNSERTWLLRM